MWVLRIQFESSRKATCACNFGAFFRAPYFVLFKVCLVFHNSFLFPTQFVVLFISFSLFSCFLCFWDGISYNPSWTQTCYVVACRGFTSKVAFSQAWVSVVAKGGRLLACLSIAGLGVFPVRQLLSLRMPVLPEGNQRSECAKWQPWSWSLLWQTASSLLSHWGQALTTWKSVSGSGVTRCGCFFFLLLLLLLFFLETGLIA